MYLLGLILWVAASGGIAWFVATLLTRRTKKPWLRPLLILVLMPIVFLAPLADEIIGKFQFDRLCEEAKEVKIHATHPVGEELYTPEGKWRRSHLETLRRSGQIGDTREESNRLQKVYESLVRWDMGSPFPEEIPATIPIRKYHTRIYDTKDGRLLAEWNGYGTSGGWVSRNFETPFLVRSQCMPNIGQQLDEKILPYSKNSGDQK